MFFTVKNRVILVAAALCLVPGVTFAAPTGESFCQRAQQIVAGSELVAKVSVHDDFDAFVESKAFSDPLQVQAYFSNPPAGDNGLPRVLSCKMKTAERLNAAHPIEPPVATGDTSCQAVNQHFLDELVQKIPRKEWGEGVQVPLVDEEELTFMGPMWLRPWPFDPLYRDDEGRLHIRSKALYVPFAWWIPMPDRFKGTYYCHLVSPAFLEALLRGEAEI